MKTPSNNIIVKWLYGAPSKFLNSFAPMVNRTTLYTFIGLDGTISDFNVPRGTWSYSFKNTGSGKVFITFPTGDVMEIRGTSGASSSIGDRTEEFPGEPYIERDDRFKSIVFENIDGVLEIRCHRVIPRNS